MITDEMVKAAMDAYAIGVDRFPDDMRAALSAALAAMPQEPVAGALTFEQKSTINKKFLELYDLGMREGKHGHYETMFQAMHEAYRLASPAQGATAPAVKATKEVKQAEQIALFYKPSYTLAPLICGCGSPVCREKGCQAEKGYRYDPLASTHSCLTAPAAPSEEEAMSGELEKEVQRRLDAFTAPSFDRGIVTDLMTALATERAAREKAERERDALREAVKPFIALAQDIAGKHPGWDHDEFCLTSPGWPYTIKLGPFRRLAALSTPGETP